ncbi:MAG: cytochrome c oxidase subunit 3 [Polyangiaceae bacterium]
MTRSSVPSPTASTRPGPGLSPHRLGLYVLFASLSMLFGTAIVAFLITRAQSPVWRTPEMPALPYGLWLSTLLVVAISGTFQSALIAARSNRPTTLVTRLWVGGALALLFLFAQLQNWTLMSHALARVVVRTLYPYTFYALTGLHAAHVLGGFVPLGIVIWRARRREYSSSRHEGVLLCTQYWHYLGVVWLVLFAVLELIS